jgi:antitoxin FitA
MAQVLVRNLDEAVVEAHRARAKAKGVSLEQELRDVLQRTARPTREELLATLDRCRALTPATHVTLAEDEIREMRDTR